MFLSNFSLLYPSWGSYVFYGTLSNIDLIPYTHFAYGETGQDGGDKISSTCAGWETRISAWQEHLFLSLNIDGRRASEIFVSYLFLIPYSFITISSGTGHKHSGPIFSFMNSGTEALAQYLIRGHFWRLTPFLQSSTLPVSSWMGKKNLYLGPLASFQKHSPWLVLTLQTLGNQNPPQHLRQTPLPWWLSADKEDGMSEQDKTWFPHATDEETSPERWGD